MQIMDIKMRIYVMMVKVRLSAGSYCVCVHHIPDHYKVSFLEMCSFLYDLANLGSRSATALLRK